MPEELNLAISMSNILMVSLPMVHSIELVDPSSQTEFAFGELIVKDPRAMESDNSNEHEHENLRMRCSDSLVAWLKASGRNEASKTRLMWGNQERIIDREAEVKRSAGCRAVA